jgi:virginiamycin B lyase
VRWCGLALAVVALVAVLPAGAQRRTVAAPEPAAFVSAAVRGQEAALRELEAASPRIPRARVAIRASLQALTGALDTVGVAQLAPAEDRRARTLLVGAAARGRSALGTETAQRVGALVRGALAATRTALGLLRGAPGQPEFAELPIPLSPFGAFEVAVGADGHVWVTGSSGSAVVEFPSLDPGSTPVVHKLGLGTVPRGITIGPDGSVYVAETGSMIGGHLILRIDRAGKVTEHPTPSGAGGPWEVVVGPDGALWYTEVGAGKVGRLDPATGRTTEFPLPTPFSQPQGLTVGADGALWGTEVAANKVFRMTTSGRATEYAIPSPRSLPVAIAAGRDKFLWVTEFASGKMLRVSLDGTMREFPLADRRAGPFGITSTPDGNVWFTLRNTNRVATITPAGRVYEYPLPTANAQLTGIAPAGRRSFLVAEFAGDRIGHLSFPSPAGG